MKLKMFVAVSLAFAITASLNAQKKVFTEVANEISTTTRTIVQDGNVIGYLLFTQLERVSSDSFSYVIKVLDENLNDIGKVEFNDQSLRLQSVVFQNDLLHLAFFKTNLQKDIKQRSLKVEIDSEKSFLVLKSISLEGKIVNTYQKSVDSRGRFKDALANSSLYYFIYQYRSLTFPAKLYANGDKGIMLIYQDDNKTELLSFNNKFELDWTKNLSFQAGYHDIIITEKNCNIVTQDKYSMPDKTYLTVYELSTGKELIKKQQIVDKKTKLNLVVFGVEKDPKSGNLVVMGKTYEEGLNKFKNTSNEVKRRALTAFGTIIYNDNNPKERQEMFNYFRPDIGGSQSDVFDEKGKLTALGDYPFIKTAYRDFNGNTLFVGNGVRYTLKYGSIVSSALLFGAVNAAGSGAFSAGSLLVPGLISLGGYSKSKFTDGFVIKQDTKSKLSLVNNTKLDEVSYVNTKILTERIVYSSGNSKWVNRNFIPFKNQTARVNYLIYDDNKNYTILNVTTNKVLKVIPQKENKTEIEIVPAKEGHIMIIENNKKAKTITLSIESLG